jgi:hypothetical protein
VWKKSRALQVRTKEKGQVSQLKYLGEKTDYESIASKLKSYLSGTSQA